MAVMLSREVGRLLVEGHPPPETLADAAHASALETLQSMAPEEAARRVFGGGFERGFVDGDATWDGSVWGERYGGGTDATSRFGPYLYGGSGVQERVGALAEELANASTDLDKVCSMPLYLLNYIWDGDELDEDELDAGSDETAVYSCHVVGLVLDATRRVLVIADPNAGLIPGGNIEFLAVPQRERETGPSTAASQFDLDRERAAQMKKAQMKKATKKAPNKPKGKNKPKGENKSKGKKRTLGE